MQKVTPKPYAPPKTGGTGKSIRLFSLRFHFISNRHALPETGTGVTQKPAYSVFDSILLNIVRNICPLVKRKTLPAEHFVQKNKNWKRNSLSQNLSVLPAPSEREPLACPQTLHFSRKLYRYAKGPISEGAVAAGDWGSSFPKSPPRENGKAERPQTLRYPEI